MADVDVQVQYTTTERKTRKVKKTSKRRESKDGEVTVTEVEQTNTTNNDDGYVLRWPNLDRGWSVFVRVSQVPISCRVRIRFSDMLIYEYEVQFGHPHIPDLT